jgi:hypothetical protein
MPEEKNKCAYGAPDKKPLGADGKVKRCAKGYQKLGLNLSGKPLR